MKIKIIAVGKIKEKYLKDAIDEYKKRLSKFCNLSIVEVSESIAKVENDSNIKKSIDEESREIISKIKNEYVIALDIDGKEYSTLEFYNKFKDIKIKDEFIKRPPSKKKMSQKWRYYRETGKLNSPIILDENLYLVDGYTSYLIAIADGIKTVDITIRKEQWKWYIWLLFY